MIWAIGAAWVLLGCSFFGEQLRAYFGFPPRRKKGRHRVLTDVRFPARLRDTTRSTRLEPRMSLSTTVLMEACPHCGSEEFTHLNHDSCYERWIERGHSPDETYDAMQECEHYECRKCGNEL